MDPTNANTALASALVEELARSGVSRAAISPGSRSTPLAVALWRQPEIEVQVLIDERSAGFYALGCGLESGAPAAVLTTSGSAAANLHPAVVEADEAGVPLIALTADRPPELRGIGAGQTIDQLKLYGDAVRWFSEVGTHEADDAGLLHYRSTACRAYAAALGDPRPGPVHLNLPWREPLAPVADEREVTAESALALEGRDGLPLTAVVRSQPDPDPELLEELSELLGRSPRGLILCGRQTDPAVAEGVARLAAVAGYPILAEPTSQVRLGPHDRSLVVSSYDLVCRHAPEELEPSVVLRVGEMPTSKPLRQWLTSLPELRQVVLDPDGDWNDPTRTAAAIVRASPAATLAGLAERLGGAEPGWAGAWLAADRTAGLAATVEVESLGSLSEPGAVLALGRALRDGDSVLAASSMPVRDLEAFLPPGPERVSFHANRGANGIDGLVSTAAGIAAAAAGRTWALFGDLALCHDLAGLAAARELPQLRFLVLDNGGGGIFHFLPQADSLAEDEFEALLGTPSGVDLVAAFDLHGIAAEVPASPAELDRALAGDARAVIVRTDRGQNLELHRRLAEAASAALAAES